MAPDEEAFSKLVLKLIKSDLWWFVSRIEEIVGEIFFLLFFVGLIEKDGLSLLLFTWFSCFSALYCYIYWSLCVYFYVSWDLLWRFHVTLLLSVKWKEHIQGNKIVSEPIYKKKMGKKGTVYIINTYYCY